MRLATTTYDFGGYVSTAEESMRYIHQSGFRYMDFGFNYGYTACVLSDDWKKYADSIKRTADELSVQFVQSHAPMASHPILPIEESDEHDSFVADNIKCIRFCKELGIDNIVVHSGFKRDISKEENFELNKKFYSKLLPAAEEYGVNILTENFTLMHEGANTYWIDSAKDLKELIDYVDHPLFHACWDFGHANTTPVPPDESLRILGDHVLAIHAQDNAGVGDIRVAYQDPHLPPLFGSLNLDCVMHGLEEINYKGAFTFETGLTFSPARYKRQYEGDNRFQQPLPLEIRLQGERLIYMIGKYILETYDCFEG